MVQVSTIGFARERFIKEVEPKPKIKFERTVDKGATRAVEVASQGSSKKSKKFKVKKPKKASRILGKPKGELIKRLSATQTIKQIAASTDTRMVTPEPEEFMDREMRKERMSFLGGFDL